MTSCDTPATGGHLAHTRDALPCTGSAEREGTEVARRSRPTPGWEGTHYTSADLASAAGTTPTHIDAMVTRARSQLRAGNGWWQEIPRPAHRQRTPYRWKAGQADVEAWITAALAAKTWRWLLADDLARDAGIGVRSLRVYQSNARTKQAATGVRPTYAPPEPDSPGRPELYDATRDDVVRWRSEVASAGRATVGALFTGLFWCLSCSEYRRGTGVVERTAKRKIVKAACPVCASGMTRILGAN